MKELNQIILGKGLFTSIKGYFVWQKGTWTIQKDWILLSGTLYEVSDLRMLYLCKKDPAPYSWKLFLSWSQLNFLLYRIILGQSVSKIIRILTFMIGSLSNQAFKNIFQYKLYLHGLKVWKRPDFSTLTQIQKWL